MINRVDHRDNNRGESKWTELSRWPGWGQIGAGLSLLLMLFVIVEALATQ